MEKTKIEKDVARAKKKELAKFFRNQTTARFRKKNSEK